MRPETPDDPAKAEAVLFRAGCLILGALTRLTPVARRQWGEALIAETQAVPAADRVRFLMGATLGLLQVIAAHHLERAWSDRSLLASALMCGLLVGWVDTSSATRDPLRILILVTCIAAGCVQPAGSWRYGALIGIGVAAAAGLDPAGPYAYDAADKWFPLLPAMLLASAAGWLRKKLAHG